MNYIFDSIDQSARSSTSKEVLKRNVVHQLFGVDISPKLVKSPKQICFLEKMGTVVLNMQTAWILLKSYLHILMTCAE